MEYLVNTNLKGDLAWLNNRPIFASISGGKDSTAMGLYLQERGIKFTPIVFDTGFEHPETWKYIKEILEPLLGEFKYLRNNKYFKDELPMLGGMEQAIFRKQIFPSAVRPYCTIELKVTPALNFMSEVRALYKAKPVNCVGVRAEESAKRSKLKITHEQDECTTWRPILNLKESEVIQIHKRHKIQPNPLYLRGMRRVGCYPCIHSTKQEIRLLAEQEPERVEYLIDLESRVNKHFEHKEKKDPLTFFGPKRSKQRNTVSEVVEWSRTDRKGEEIDDVDRLENQGCVTWGLCEPLIKSGDQLELFQIEKRSKSV